MSGRVPETFDRQGMRLPQGVSRRISETWSVISAATSVALRLSIQMVRIGRARLAVRVGSDDTRRTGGKCGLCGMIASGTADRGMLSFMEDHAVIPSFHGLTRAPVMRPIVRRLLMPILMGASRLIGAQGAQDPVVLSRLSAPVALQIGIPTGAFAEHVAIAGGFGGGLLLAVSPTIGLRGDLGFQIYGAENRRVPLGSGALSLVNVDVTTTNAIFSGAIGVQVGLPPSVQKKPYATPYAGAQVGFGSFVTSTSVQGSNQDAGPFASSTNLSDVAMAKTLYAGLYAPLRRSTTLLDIGLRRTWHGRAVRFLTQGDITQLPSGEVVLRPRESVAELFTLTIGVTFRVGKPAN